MKVTFYGFDDNDPPSAEIAHPGTRHDKATEGTGRYDDPITLAVSEGRFDVGTIVYVPYLQKYFVMEDDCATCEDDQVDLWMGPNDSRSGPALTECQEKLTREDADVIENPDPTLPVDTTPLFINGQCTAQVHE